MSQDGVNKARRTLLVGATAGVGAVGAGFLAVPFVKSWMPSEKAKAAGAPAKIDVSKVEPGAMVTAEWRGKPVYVARRTEDMLNTLEGLADRLKDPENANKAQQPEYADNLYRSRKPELIVLLGVCTHLVVRLSMYLKLSLSRLIQTGRVAGSAHVTVHASTCLAVYTVVLRRLTTWLSLPTCTRATT